MSLQWYLRQPQLAEEIRACLRAKQPNLHLIINDSGKSEIRGTFSVLSQGKVLDQFRITIELPNDYPKSLPIVREVGGRIPWKADFHVNEKDGTACVLIPDDKWRCFPEGAPFSQFLEGPLHNFFLGQSLVSIGEKWPFGEWGHGATGVYEYYQELFYTNDPATIGSYLFILSKLSLKRHWPCPCGSGRKISKCCQSKIISLRKKIPPDVARKALEQLRKQPDHLTTAQNPYPSA